jgi:hypothetical protein
VSTGDGDRIETKTERADVIDPKREAGITPNRTQRLRRFLPRSLVVAAVPLVVTPPESSDPGAEWGLCDIPEQTSPLLGVLPWGFP